MATKQKRYVLVTTQYRGVFAGLLESESDSVVQLSEARMCIYWSTAMRGVLGLASAGPDAACRIGSAVKRVKLLGVTSITEITSEARARWEAAPWK